MGARDQVTSLQTDAVPGPAGAAPAATEPRAKRHAAARSALQHTPARLDPPCDAHASRRRKPTQARDIGTTPIPLIRPNPPRLSELTDGLAEIERSGIFSNYGPMNARLEEGLVAGVFGAEGACVTVGNATLGLMLAIKQAVGWRPRGRYALMPSFTFAATAHAALWCGLTPLLCDIDGDTWLPDAAAEEALLDRYGDEIALILPNATFGNCLDLARCACGTVMSSGACASAASAPRGSRAPRGPSRPSAPDRRHAAGRSGTSAARMAPAA